MATLHDQEATIIVTTTALLMHLDTRFQDTSFLSSVGLVKYLNRSPEWKCIGRPRCREARRWNSFLRMQYCHLEMSLVSNICYLELTTRQDAKFHSARGRHLRVTRTFSLIKVHQHIYRLSHSTLGNCENSQSSVLTFDSYTEMWRCYDLHLYVQLCAMG